MHVTVCVDCGTDVESKYGSKKRCDLCLHAVHTQRVRKWQEKNKKSCKVCGTTIHYTSDLCRPCSNKAQIKNPMGIKNVGYTKGCKDDCDNCPHPDCILPEDKDLPEDWYE